MMLVARASFGGIIVFGYGHVRPPSSMISASVCSMQLVFVVWGFFSGNLTHSQVTGDAAQRWSIAWALGRARGYRDTYTRLYNYEINSAQMELETKAVDIVCARGSPNAKSSNGNSFTGPNQGTM